VTVLGPYYGQRPPPSELDSDFDIEVDALQARVCRLEALLREARDYLSTCSVPECDCIASRIQSALEVPHAD
jgi:hypothetical protein